MVWFTYSISKKINCQQLDNMQYKHKKKTLRKCAEGLFERLHTCKPMHKQTQ